MVGSDQNTTHVGVGWSQLLYVGGRKGVCWSLVTVGPKYGRRVLRANPDAPIRVCFTTHNLSKPSIKYINSLGVPVLSNVYLEPCPHIYTHCLSKGDINFDLVYKCNLFNRGAWNASCSNVLTLRIIYLTRSLFNRYAKVWNEPASCVRVSQNQLFTLWPCLSGELLKRGGGSVCVSCQETEPVKLWLPGLTQFLVG